MGAAQEIMHHTFPAGSSHAYLRGLDNEVGAVRDQTWLDQAIFRCLEDEIVPDELVGQHLETTLVSCRRIGAATGILMAGLKITEAAAFDMLRRISQAQNRKLRFVADDIVTTGDFWAVPQREVTCPSSPVRNA